MGHDCVTVLRQHFVNKELEPEVGKCKSVLSSECSAFHHINDLENKKVLIKQNLYYFRTQSRKSSTLEILSQFEEV